MKQLTIQELKNEKVQIFADALTDMIIDGCLTMELFSGCTPDTKFVSIKLHDVEKVSIQFDEDDVQIEIVTKDYMFYETLDPEEFNNIDLR